MQNAQHQNLVGFIWNIANKLRGPYRPPQYRRVMLPLIVLRRFDLVLAENKQKVLDEKKRLEDKGITGPALEKSLSRIAATDRKQELFNTSGFTFEKLLGDAPNIAGNLIAYIQGFSPRARDIFDKFEFETEIAKLDEANRLYLIIKEFCSADINLSPKAISNLQMGYLFEELVRKFNEQANEEAGDHFTPREVIRLMVQLLFTGEDGIYEKGIYRSVYDPTAADRSDHFGDSRRLELGGRRYGRIHPRSPGGRSCAGLDPGLDQRGCPCGPWSGYRVDQVHRSDQLCG